MSKRHKVILSLTISLMIVSYLAFVVVDLFLWYFISPFVPSTEGIAVHVVIDNRTNKTIGPFVMTDRDDSAPLIINQIEPLSVIEVDFKREEGFGENSIGITDNNGRRYDVVGYFEQPLSGRVVIRIECVNPDGYSGKKRLLANHILASFHWDSWGIRNCEHEE